MIRILTLIDFLRKSILSLLTELVLCTVPTFLVSTSLAKHSFAGCLSLVLLCSCSSTTQLAGNRHGGVLRLTHLGSDPKTLNPWIADDAASSGFASKLFIGLIDTDPDTDEVLPFMAESFKIRNGGKEIFVKLRDDLLWSDGQKLDAEDVEYTWNTLIRDEVAQSSTKDILTVDGEFPKVTMIDSLNLLFETKEVFAPFLKSLSTAIAPKHDVERFLAEHEAVSLEQKQKAFNQYLSIQTEPDTIVNSGPFRLGKVVRGERLEFLPNPNFFLRDEHGAQLPYLDKIVYSYVRDSTADTFKFLADESYILSVTAQNSALIKNLEQQYDFTLYDTGPTSGTNFLWFNLSKNIPEPMYSWFNNENFRQAVSYAIDRENIVNNVFQGLGAPLFTAESLKSPFLNEDLMNGYPRDLSKSKILLQEAGFSFVTNSDSSELELHDKAGNRVEFDLYTNAGNQEREFISVITVSNLKELGIKVNFKLLEFNNFVSRLMQGKDYEAGIIGLTGGNEPNGGANVWRSDARLHMFDVKSGQEEAITRPWEKEIDQLFSKAVKVMEHDKRKVFYDRYQELVYEHNPMIYIASPKQLTAIKHKVAGVRQTKYAGMMPYLYRVYIKSES